MGTLMPFEKDKRRQLYVLQVKFGIDRECLTVLGRARGSSFSIRYRNTNTWNGRFHADTTV